jgi:hypothetical protein
MVVFRATWASARVLAVTAASSVSACVQDEPDASAPCAVDEPEIVGFNEEGAAQVESVFTQMATEIRGPMPCIERVERVDGAVEYGGSYFKRNIKVFPSWPDGHPGLPGVVRHELCHAIDKQWGLRYEIDTSIPAIPGVEAWSEADNDLRSEAMALVCGLEMPHLALLRDLISRCPDPDLQLLVDRVFEDIYWPAESGVRMVPYAAPQTVPLPAELRGLEPPPDRYSFVSGSDGGILVAPRWNEGGVDTEGWWVFHPNTGRWELEFEPGDFWGRGSSWWLLSSNLARFRPLRHDLEDRLAFQMWVTEYLPGGQVATWGAVDDSFGLPPELPDTCVRGSASTVVSDEAWGVAIVEGRELSYVDLAPWFDRVVPFQWRRAVAR